MVEPHHAEDADYFAAGYCRGQLLVALPEINDGPFHRTVVLVLDHDADGALGVVLNRPLDADVDDVLPGWADVVTAPAALFEGGPVSTNSALAVALLQPVVDDTPLGWRSMFGRVGLVDLDVPAATIAAAVAGMRVFAGYAGWGAGQLEAEIEDGSWAVVDASDDDVVASQPQDLWRDVLRRQAGDLRMLSTFPDDPMTN